MAVIATGCSNKSGLTSGVDLENLDTSASAVDDFYQYACGGWMAKHPLDEEHARFGTFDQLAEDNQEQMKALIADLTTTDNEPGSIADKIATLYLQGMDSAALNEQGAAPLEPFMKEVAALADRKALVETLPLLHRRGFYPFFALFNEANLENATMQMGWLYQTGLGMGDRDYYIKTDDNTANIRKAYKTLMTTLFGLSGYDKLSGLTPQALTEMVFALETKVANAQIDKVKLRNPAETWHKMALADAQKFIPAVDLKAYFAALGAPAIDTFNLCMPAYTKAVNDLLQKENVETIKAYYAWMIISDAARYLSDDFVAANFEFSKVLSGVKQMRPRWKRVMGTVNGAMGEAVGQMYVKKFFPAESKERMLTLIENLREAFTIRISEAQWMDQQTKDRALEKLSTVLVKVGYPDNWRDYSGLDIQHDSYFANIVRSNVFDTEYMLSKINKPTDKSEWGMTPQMVNAYYNPTTNEICSPAGILQPPFFDHNADDAANYGAIGVVIGHELTHGFDDQGRQYDKDGNFNDWWQPQDAENFERQAKVLVDWFNGIRVLDNPETYGNGELTLGENIADNGGLHMSYRAMEIAKEKGQVNSKEMDGFTPEQRFFIAYATVWAGNITNEQILNQTQNDPHSLGRWRVNGTLPHITEFVEAFGVKEGDGMYIAPENRALLW